VFTTRLQIQHALSRLGRRLALADGGEYSFVICGGSALNLAGLVDRPTRDVDVLGLVKGTEKPAVMAEPLSEEILQAAHLVASDLNLPIDWLNDSALAVHRLGLPPGILKRAQRREFGPCLTLYVIGRQDQTALKLYAALDRQKGRRHLEDLAAINPTPREMRIAIRWLLDRKTSVEFRHAVRNICHALGFHRLRSFIATQGAPPKRIKKPKRPSQSRGKPVN
jgi:hypothetical protein